MITSRKCRISETNGDLLVHALASPTEENLLSGIFRKSAVIWPFRSPGPRTRACGFAGKPPHTDIRNALIPWGEPPGGLPGRAQGALFGLRTTTPTNTAHRTSPAGSRLLLLLSLCVSAACRRRSFAAKALSDNAQNERHRQQKCAHERG